jgi:hypothetical protein
MGLTAKQDGFARIDSVVRWCREAGLYLYLDMHDAPVDKQEIILMIVMDIRGYLTVRLASNCFVLSGRKLQRIIKMNLLFWVMSL